MHSYLRILIFAIIVWSAGSPLWAQAESALEESEVRLSNAQKEILIAQWIEKSMDRFKWSHEARLGFADSALEMATEIRHDNFIHQALYSLGELYFQEGNFEKALEVLNPVLDYAISQEDFRRQVETQNLMGSIYRLRGEFYEALKITFQAYEISEKQLQGALFSLSANNLGIIYRNLGDQERSGLLFSQALEKAQLLKDTQQIIIALNNIGNLNWYEKDYESAAINYNSAIELAHSSNDLLHVATLYNNLGNVCRDTGDVQSALEYYYQALDILERAVALSVRAAVYRNMGLAYNQIGDLNKALEFTEASLKLTLDLQLHRFSRDNYLNLSRIYEVLGDREKAFEAMKLYNELNQQLFNDQLLNSITYLEDKYAELLQKEQLYKFKSQRNLYILLFSILFMGLAVFVSIILFRSYREKRLIIMQLQQTLEDKDLTEKALRKSEENYFSLIKTLNEGLLVLDDLQQITFLNDKACKLLGIKKNLAMGRKLDDFLLSAEDLQYMKDKMELQKMGISDQYEIQMRRHTGEAFWASLSVAPILDDNEYLKSTVAIISDVTERKKGESEIHDLTSNLNQKIKQLNCMYDISDLSGVPGISFEEIIERSLQIIPFGLKYSHDVAVQIEFNNRVFSSPQFRETPWSFLAPLKVQKKKLGYVKVVYLEEKPTVNKDPFHFNEKILIKNIAEKLGQVVEAKNMENILLESREKLREVQKLARIGNWEYNLLTKVGVFSDTFFEIAGISPEKARFFDQQQFIEAIHPQDKQLFESFHEKLLQSKQDLLSLEYRMIDSQGSIRYIHSSGKIVADENKKPVRFVATIQDITQQRLSQEMKSRAEIAIQMSQAKQQFLANISHEMRTPLNGIQGMTEFLQKTRLNVRQTEYVELIRESSEGLLNIINNVLDLSRIEADKLQIKPRKVVLQTLAQNVETLFAAQVRRKKIDLHIEMDPELPEVIEADEKRVFQVISNLISNAVKFTERGRVTFSMHLQQQTPEQYLVGVKVSDTGIGIAPQYLETLFKPYEQWGSSPQNKEGTGMGLAISHKLVELMGGTIHAQNIENQGSCFHFTFRAYPLKDKTPAVPPLINKVDFKGLKLGYHILLVEDKVVNQKITRLMLEEVGCKVSLAQNGKEALELLGKNAYNLILMDINMPVMDGLTAMKLMKEQYADLPPVIALSANAMDGDKERYLAAGMNDYIAKPVKSKDLYTKIIQWNSLPVSPIVKKATSRS